MVNFSVSASCKIMHFPSINMPGYSGMVSPGSIVVFFPVGLSSLSRHFQQPTKPAERPTGKNKSIEWDDGEKGNYNSILTSHWYLKDDF